MSERTRDECVYYDFIKGCELDKLCVGPQYGACDQFLEYDMPDDGDEPETVGDAIEGGRDDE